MNPIYGLRDEISKHSRDLQRLSIAIGRLDALAADVQHLNLRHVRDILGLSQAEMGRMLAYYLGREYPYLGTTVGMWEWHERRGDATLAWKRAARPRVVAAYRALIAIAVDNATGGRLMLCYHAGWRRHVVRAHCTKCQREFTPRDARQVRCSHCIGRKRGSHKCTQTNQGQQSQSKSRTTSCPTPTRRRPPTSTRRHQTA